MSLVEFNHSSEPLHLTFRNTGKMHFLPHKNAPLFNDPALAVKVLGEVMAELQLLRQGKIKQDQVDMARIIEVSRQAGLCSLYFFLKYIAGSNGPFNFLNEGVHLDLCNFRQSPHCMNPGSRVLMLLPRGFAKTTISTIGGDAWELLRNGNLRIRIVNATIDKAHQFMHAVQRVFDSNGFFKQCYPEAAVAITGRASRWNSEEAVMPHATRFFSEPSLKAGGATGASEGDHHDIINMDDIIGLDDVDAEYNPNQRMKQTSVWMDTNLTALLVSPQHSRVIGAATRFGRGDVYQSIVNDCREVFGYPQGFSSFKPNKLGQWVIYYRHVVEEGKASNPFVMTVQGFEHLMKTKPLVAALQYANNADISINNELAKMAVKHCYMVSKDNDWIIHRAAESKEDSPNSVDRPVRLSQCNVCMSVDWAGSDKKRSVHTSRTSIGVWAIDAYERKYRIDQVVGYFDLPAVFNHIFSLHGRWSGYIKATLLEANAMQRGIYDLIVEEQHKRGVYIAPIEINGKGDKVVRIRATLSVALSQGTIYLTEGASVEFIEEQLAFPSDALDVLDESQKACAWLKPPATEEVVYAKEQKKLFRRHSQIESAAGY